jgi:acylaminoacyl-peptidase
MRLLGILLIGAFGVATLPGGQQCLAPESIFRMAGVSDPQYRPDGSAIAFTHSWIDILDDTTYSNVRIWSSGTMRTLHSGKLHERSARWSPDGKSLAYVSDRTRKTRIHILSIDSGQERVLTDIDGSVSNVTWSPDGKWLAFFSFVGGKSEWNPAMPQPPAGAKWAPAPVSVTSLRWAMDGSGVMHPGSTQLFVAAASGGAPRQISRIPYWHTSYLTQPELEWSRDSQSVLSPAVRAPEGWGVLNENSIYAFPVDGGEPRRIGPPGWHQRAAVASPDGRHIAYVGFQWKGQSYHVGHLYVADPDGSHSRSLTGALDRDILAPAWSADSKSIFFLTEDGGDTNLHVATLDGSVREITHGKQRISAYSLSRGGEVAAIFTTPTQPGALIKFGADSPASTKTLFDPNAETLAACRLSTPEDLNFASFDGRKIQGWLLKPAGFDPSKKYPLLLSIHGGPHSAYGNMFQHETQMFADHGYVVLYINPRGSTGYGEQFAEMIQHKWPGDDIQDVLTGVDRVVAAGYIDPARMAVVGGSGGGLMTTWTITATTRFRAAVAWWPVTNWFTHVGSADNGYYIGSIYRAGLPWENPQDYIDHSPLFRVKNVKTPTMLITGEEDWRTPIAQTQEFYRALKELGVDTVFLRVPGESHGSSKRPSHRMEVIVNTLAWLDRYIAPGPKTN